MKNSMDAEKNLFKEDNDIKNVSPRNDSKGYKLAKSKR